MSVRTTLSSVHNQATPTAIRAGRAMSALRVLHIGPLPPPLGGVAVMMQALLSSSQLTRYENISFDTSAKTTWEQVGVKKLTLKKMFRRVSLAVRIGRRVRALRPHIVHFQCGSGGIWDFPGDVLLFRAARLTGAKTVFHWHRDPDKATYPGRSPLARAFFARSLDDVDAVLLLAKSYQCALNRLAPQLGNRTHVVPNTFESDLLALPSARGVGAGPRLVFIGRLSREKGIHDLLTVAEQIVPSRPDLVLMLAGTAPPSEGGNKQVQHEILARHLEDNVKLAGPVSGQSKLAFFQTADILVMPSYRESFGIAALEAMAAGIPVVAYNVGILPELVADSGSGLLAEVGNTQAFLHHVEYLIDNRNVCERMGKNGHSIARERYAPDIVAGAVRAIYEQIR